MEVHDMNNNPAMEDEEDIAIVVEEDLDASFNHLMVCLIYDGEPEDLNEAFRVTPEDQREWLDQPLPEVPDHHPTFVIGDLGPPLVWAEYLGTLATIETFLGPVIVDACLFAAVSPTMVNQVNIFQTLVQKKEER